MGAGRSASSLIKYLLQEAAKETWELTVGDVSMELAAEKSKGSEHARAIAFDVTNETQRKAEINRANLVISMLPPALHILAAKDCVALGKNMVTASYISPEIQSLDKEARDNGVLIMNECGLDPGIDHMSAMQIIHELQRKGANLKSFKSYTGGLVAPESNDNPWGYKFTWNPRNVILAGQGTARYIENGEYKYIPYNRLFEYTDFIEVDGHGSYEGYANRDSLAYRHYYGIDKIPTLLRGTLRNTGYCEAWNAFVKLGITDDTFIMEGSGKMTYAGYIRSFLPANHSYGFLPVDLANFLGVDPNSEVMKKISWTGLLDEEAIGLPDSTPAQILQSKLESKWILNPKDKDMIVMLHHFIFELDGQEQNLQSVLVVKGDDPVYTAMSKTVGLPLGIVAKRMLNKQIHLSGVHLPVTKELYEPVLQELSSMNIRFVEKLY